MSGGVHFASAAALPAGAVCSDRLGNLRVGGDLSDAGQGPESCCVLRPPHRRGQCVITSDRGTLCYQSACHRWHARGSMCALPSVAIVALGYDIGSYIILCDPLGHSA